MVTMKDVARAAGVSQPAVSYAYNRPDQLSAEVRKRILKVASDLNYPGPDPVGRGLRRGSVGAIGLMITDSLPTPSRDPATVQLLKGIAEIGELSEVMLMLLPLRSAGHAGEPAPTSKHVRPKCPATASSTGSSSTLDPDQHRAVEAALSRGLPTVIIDAPRVRAAPYVGIRDREQAAGKPQHLPAGTGSRWAPVHRLHLTGNPGRTPPAPAQARSLDRCCPSASSAISRRSGRSASLGATFLW